jgi:hypothetical protein
LRLCVRAPRTDSSAAVRRAAAWAGEGADSGSGSEGEGKMGFKAGHQRRFWRQKGNPT